MGKQKKQKTYMYIWTF